MTGPNEFWLSLHVLCEAHDAEGRTPQDRSAAITAQFETMSPVVQRQLLRELQYLAMVLPDLAVPITCAYRAPIDGPCVAKDAD